MEPQEYLFVYGTLRAGMPGSPARRLARRARLHGGASVEGALYDLGRYPGLVLGGADAGAIGGDVFALGSGAAAILAVLDAYEGCGPGDPRPHLFARVRARVRLASGEPVEAWLYEYRGDVAGARRIARWP